jgi:putative peptide zinc metalloprotease protein
MASRVDVSASPARGLHDVWFPQARVDLDIADSHDERVIVTVPRSGAQMRLAPAALRLLQACDGKRDEMALAASLAPAPPSQVALLLAEFDRLGLLERRTASEEVRAPRWRPTRQRSSNSARRSHPTRLRYRPPGTFVFELLDAQSWIQRLRRPNRAIRSWPVQALVWILSVSGVALWVAEGKAFVADLSSPVTLLGVGIGIAILILSTFVHELAHAGSLDFRGGRVRRMGLMLLYGSPAMYCDVSDAWRLPRGQRVFVALAGVRVNFFAAGLGGLMAVTTASGPWHDVGVVVGGTNALMAVINLCPLVKFDGYLALIGWLDAPNLRAKCMREAGAGISYLLFGGPRPARLEGRRIAFGLAAAVTGPGLVLTAMLGYQPVLLATFGPYGAVVVLIAYVLAGSLFARKFIGAARSAVHAGAHILRTGIVSAALVATFAVALAGVQIPFQTSSVFFEGGGSTYLVRSASIDSLGDIVGHEVTLHTPGLFLHPVIATGTVCGPSEQFDVPVGAGGSVRFSTSTTTVQAVSRICDVQAGTALSGIAEVALGNTSLGHWLRIAIFDPAIASLSANVSHSTTQGS